jgi:hypothetical protein
VYLDHVFAIRRDGKVERPSAAFHQQVAPRAVSNDQYCFQLGINPLGGAIDDNPLPLLGVKCVMVHGPVGHHGVANRVDGQRNGIRQRRVGRALNNFRQIANGKRTRRRHSQSRHDACFMNAHGTIVSN